MKTTENERCVTMEEPAPASLEERVARMEDYRAIHELLAHYARCVDARDGVGAASVFCENGELHGPGAPAIAGRQRIARLYGKLLGRMTSSSHMVGNEQVLFTSRDTACAHCVLLAWEGFGAALDASVDNRFSLGRYELELVREADGEWRVSAMNVHFAGQTGTGRMAEHLNRPWPPQPRS